MKSIKLDKVNDISNNSWLVAVSRDYDVPKDAQIFMGLGLRGETVAVWVGKDGGGFGAIDRDPEGYTKQSNDLDALDGREWFKYVHTHSGVDEHVFDPGTFDPDAQTVDLNVVLSIF